MPAWLYDKKGKCMIMKCKNFAKIGLFVGGVVFGSAGFKLLSSRDAKTAYAHTAAAALRVKESVLNTVASVQENAADILAEAKDINAMREDACEVDCSEGEAEAEETTEA